MEMAVTLTMDTTTITMELTMARQDTQTIIMGTEPAWDQRSAQTELTQIEVQPQELMELSVG